MGQNHFLAGYGTKPIFSRTWNKVGTKPFLPDMEQNHLFWQDMEQNNFLPDMEQNNFLPDMEQNYFLS